MRIHLPNPLGCKGFQTLIKTYLKKKKKEKVLTFLGNKPTVPNMAHILIENNKIALRKAREAE